MATLGKQIRRARERARMSQQELADAVGKSVRAVNDWENNRASPRSSIGALEEVLGVSLDGEIPSEPDLPPLFRQMVDGLSPGQRARAIGVLNEPPADAAQAPAQRRTPRAS